MKRFESRDILYINKCAPMRVVSFGGMEIKKNLVRQLGTCDGV